MHQIDTSYIHTYVHCTPKSRRRLTKRKNKMEQIEVKQLKPRKKGGGSVKALSPAVDAICKVTGRRHRVSPCRSAYFASPWWSLTFDLRRRSREAALLFPESWWHLTMRLSPVSFFMIRNPEHKHHPNYTKTDQLPISEVITGLPRPYHHRSMTVRQLSL